MESSSRRSPKGSETPARARNEWCAKRRDLREAPDRAVGGTGTMRINEGDAEARRDQRNTCETHDADPSFRTPSVYLNDDAESSCPTKGRAPEEGGHWVEGSTHESPAGRRSRPGRRQGAGSTCTCCKYRLRCPNSVPFPHLFRASTFPRTWSTAGVPRLARALGTITDDTTVLRAEHGVGRRRSASPSRGTARAGP